MRCGITGAAGFIGSHLAEAMAQRGDEVTGIDCFTSYYDPALKRANADAVRAAGASLLEVDLRTAPLDDTLEGITRVYHLAAQPGVRASWPHFSLYLEHNVAVTQRLLEWARADSTRQLVIASSSSVYGNAARYPVHEDDHLRPFSPYGVTKHSVEDLCRAYAQNWGVRTVLLRYFTVYGPRQRPDMATARLIGAALGGEEFPLYGDGSARRDFTFVADVVDATIAAGDADLAPATPINVAGGSECSMTDLIALVGELVGSPVPIDVGDAQPGDVTRTGGAIDRAVALLGWRPKVSLADGVAAQVDWARRHLAC